MNIQQLNQQLREFAGSPEQRENDVLPFDYRFSSEDTLSLSELESYLKEHNIYSELIIETKGFVNGYLFVIVDGAIYYAIGDVYINDDCLTFSYSVANDLFTKSDSEITDDLVNSFYRFTCNTEKKLKNLRDPNFVKHISSQSTSDSNAELF